MFVTVGLQIIFYIHCNMHICLWSASISSFSGSSPSDQKLQTIFATLHILIYSQRIMLVTELANFSRMHYCTPFQDPGVGGVRVTSTSQVWISAILVLKVWHWDICQWHNVKTKLFDDWSNVEMGLYTDMRMYCQGMYSDSHTCCTDVYSDMYTYCVVIDLKTPLF